MSSAVDMGTFMRVTYLPSQGGKTIDYPHHKITVREWDRKGEDANFYTFWLPPALYYGYPIVISFDAFFNSLPKSGKRPSTTSVRSFRAYHEDELTFNNYDKALLEKQGSVDFSGGDGLYRFYEAIGYDRKTKKYASGERILKWDGRQFV